MKNEDKCPGSEYLERMLCDMLDAVEAPDLTGRVMAGIEGADLVDGSAQGTACLDTLNRMDNGLLNIFSYLVTAGVGFALILLYNFLPGLIDFELRPVAVVKILTALERWMRFIDETLEAVAAGILPGGPLIPPLMIVLAVLLINLLGKRRISDV